MVSDLEKDVLDAINKSLPGQVAGALVERLKQADADKANLESHMVAIDRLNGTLSELRTANAELKSRATLVEQRESAVATRERAVADVELRLKLAEKDVACAQQGKQDLKELVGIVFRNNEVRRQVHTSTTEPVMSTPMPGSAPYPTGNYINKNTTVTETNDAN